MAKFQEIESLLAVAREEGYALDIRNAYRLARTAELAVGLITECKQIGHSKRMARNVLPAITGVLESVTPIESR